MRLRSLVSSLALAALLLPAAALAQENRLYTFAEVGKVTPPAQGRALLVVSRELPASGVGSKEELLYLDEMPLGFMPDKAAIAREVDPGMRRIWALGAGAGAETWLDIKPNKIYLLRMRQTSFQGTLYSDFVRETPRGYRQYAIDRGIRRCDLTSKGDAWMKDKLGKHREGTPAPADSVREAARRRQALPITWAEARYRDPAADKDVAQMDARVGRFEMDATSIRFKDAKRDLAIPLDDVTYVQYGGTMWDTPPAWVRVSYRQGEVEREALFSTAEYPGSTPFYNAVFGVLDDKLTIGLD